MADQWDLYNEPGVDFIKRMPCPALNALPPFYFISEPRKKKQSKAKRNRIQRTQNEKKSDITKTKEEETRVFMCAASGDCEADLTILDTVLVLSLPLSHSLSPLAVVSSSFVSLLQSQALWAARGCWPLLLYFLTSFMGCHVSNGNGNLCVCN